MATKQDGRSNNKGGNNNPKGRGGFGDNPQHRSNGYWKAEDSISFQYRKLLKMPVKEFRLWEQNTPEDERTTAQSIAYAAVIKARKQFVFLKEITDRTEGRAFQSMDVTSGGEPLTVIFKDYEPDADDD